MATAERIAGPFNTAFTGLARGASLNIRLTVLVSLVLIAGSFAGAAALQMRLDRVHALSQARWYEARRARDIATDVDTALDHMADAGRAFADGRSVVGAGVKNIAVFDLSGVWGRVLHGSALEFPDLPTGWVAHTRHENLLIGSSVLAFRHRQHVVAVFFDPKSLLPPTTLDGVALIAPDGNVLLSRLGPDVAAHVRCAHWPILVQTSVDTEGTLLAWYGSLPLYLFVILGPALAGACLSVLFVGEFERRQKASAAVKALRSVRPFEARLLVRLASAEREAAESQRSKSEFIAHMSHELRTPLNAIIGFSEVIEKGMYGPAGNEKYVEYARDIADAGRGLHAKIGDILEYANVEAGRHPLNPSRFDLAGLAGACVAEHQGRAFSRRIGLELGVAEPTTVFADRAATARILTVLLSNSLRYTPEGGAIRVDVRNEDFACVLTLADSGAGFSDNEARLAANAFARFDRAGALTGTGLGLAIAASLARRMGGALAIGGNHGEGGLTAFRLPSA